MIILLALILMMLVCISIDLFRSANRITDRLETIIEKLEELDR